MSILEAALRYLDGVGVPRWAWILVAILAVALAGVSNEWAIVPVGR